MKEVVRWRLRLKGSLQEIRFSEQPLDLIISCAEPHCEFGRHYRAYCFTWHLSLGQTIHMHSTLFTDGYTQYIWQGDLQTYATHFRMREDTVL